MVSSTWFTCSHHHISFKFLVTLTWYPTNLINSDTIYLEIMSEPIGKGFSSPRLIPLLMPLQLLHVLLTNCI